MAHETITYIIVPFADVTKEMIEKSAENGIDTLRHTKKGEDRVILKYIKYSKPKESESPKGPTTFINKPDVFIVPTTTTIVVDGKEVIKINYPKETLEYNSNFSEYPHAFEVVPSIFDKYQEYTYDEIMIELQKEEWHDTIPFEPL